MIMLLALPVIAAVTLVHGYLLLYAPSNILIRRARASRPTLSAVAAVLFLAGVLVVAMKVISDAVAAGAPGWLNLVVLVLTWDASKIGWLAILVIGRCARPHVAASTRQIRPSRSGTQATNCLRARRRARVNGRLRPEHTGRTHERFNRTMIEEWAYAQPFDTGHERAAALPQWLRTYNHHHGHTALGGQPRINRVIDLSGGYSYCPSREEQGGPAMQGRRRDYSMPHIRVSGTN